MANTGGTQGGSHEQHVKAGAQSHKNEGQKGASHKTEGHKSESQKGAPGKSTTGGHEKTAPGQHGGPEQHGKPGTKGS